MSYGNLHSTGGGVTTSPSIPKGKPGKKVEKMLYLNCGILKDVLGLDLINP